ncbi:MAG TPA: zf-HC2 domain-containing protein, partial [Verrucomicrobiae bacterium]|nr:zf-HC2 domain-containing protein [Verrucomicrobiae bacterium]
MSGIMDCGKAQKSFDDLSRGRLEPETAAEVRQHLADCTDCRVQEQRAARLQRLLALKRYERPTPEYFDGFLSEFHGRLLAEAQRPGWWDRVLGRIGDLVTVESARIWRYRFASATGVAVVVGLMWMSVRQTNDPSNVASPMAGADQSLVFAETTPSTPGTITAPLPTSLLQVTPADYEPAGGVVLTPASTRADSTVP